MPAALHGAWYSDDSEGAAACRAHRRGEESAIAGQLLIQRVHFNEFAEYGEGNGYQVQAVQALGSETWRVTSALSLDAEESGPDPVATEFRWMGQRLGVTHFDPVTRADSDERVYRRCAATTQQEAGG